MAPCAKMMQKLFRSYSSMLSQWKQIRCHILYILAWLGQDTLLGHFIFMFHLNGVIYDVVFVKVSMLCI